MTPYMLKKFNEEYKYKLKNIPELDILELVSCLTDLIDLINPVLSNHHEYVRYISFRIAVELGFSDEELITMIIAATLHDIGAISLKERFDTFEFDYNLDSNCHSDAGYYLLRDFPPFADIAKIIKYHHYSWDYGNGKIDEDNNEIPLMSHIINLADRVAILIENDKEVISQSESIIELIKKHKGSYFKEDLVEVFLTVAERKYFWFDLMHKPLRKLTDLFIKRHNITGKIIKFDVKSLTELTNLFSRIIDFKSPFTATHSSGVSAAGVFLARAAGFSAQELELMKIAGNLHDIGKLTIPNSILEKPGKLTDYEFNIIQRHVYYSYRVLDEFEDFDIIKIWGSFHHERINGKGYPFQFEGDELPTGSKIMAVADVFTALTEDRPYRKGMSQEKTLKLLENMVRVNSLDEEIFDLLKENFDDINDVRFIAQRKSTKLYEEFVNNIEAAKIIG